MAEIVLGIGASHTTLMNTQWDKVDHIPRAHEFKSALLESKKQLLDARPDVVVIVGSNHFRGFWLDMMPAFSIGVGQVDSAGEHGTPKGLQAVDEAFALDLCNGMLAEDFDMAFSTKLSVDHGISHAIQWIVGENIPVVPIVVNCFAPPLPSLERCLNFGETLAKVLKKIGPGKRVAVIATGGLSHRLPFPDWRKPESEDDAFLVDSWKEGRGNWSEYETRRRQIVVNAPPDLNEDFDRQTLELIEQGTLANFPKLYDEDQLVTVAGNGANEIRAWLIMAAALGYKPGKTLCYSPMPEWLTGMGVSVITP